MKALNFKDLMKDNVAFKKLVDKLTELELIIEERRHPINHYFCLIENEYNRIIDLKKENKEDKITN